MRTESGQEVSELTREEFIKYLHEGLSHLHDPGRLRRSRLAILLGVANRLDTSLALRNILIDAIESLKPRGDESSSSCAWQMHDALYCCYVQRLSQRIVADQLAVSPRQLRREQRVALEVLADHLCQQFELASQLQGGWAGGTKPGPTAPAAALSLSGEDLAWLKDVLPEKPTDLAETMPSVVDLVQPLLAQHRVCLDIQTPEGLPKLAVHPVALSQILLNLLSLAIPQVHDCQLLISARAVEWAVQIDLLGQRQTARRQALVDDDLASLEMACQIAEICAGKISVSEEDEAFFRAAATLPALGSLPVLIIDDNADALQLMQRFAAGTRYRPIVTRDPEHALELAASLHPKIIVLDVMMPQVDGWKVLGRLRQHPHTGHIPLIVCTILPQEALALSLGADGFVRKPITRQSLLAALDGQVARMATGPR